jgi:hypothetical protein
VDREPLTDAYLAECEHRARRFSGCWDAGTSGSLAADVMRLLAELSRVKGELAVSRTRETRGGSHAMATRFAS